MNIELFSCAGGMAEGFRRAGIEFDVAIDFAEDHCKSYKANLGKSPVRMDVRDFLRLAELGLVPVDEISLLVADPPCTPWSRAGLRKGTSDERDMLQETCDLIRILRPQCYLIGNVPGLNDSTQWHVVQKYIGGLQRFGYCVADYDALDAANYGVPQHRVRPFWFGHLQGPCIQWPRPTHGDPEEHTSLTIPGVEVLLPWITCHQALGHLPPKDLGRPIGLRRRNQNSKQHGSVPSRPARVVGTSNLSSKHPALEMDKPSTTVRGGGDYGHSAPPLVLVHPRHPLSDPDRPSNTITGSDGGGSKRAMRTRDTGRVGQGSRVGDPNRPSSTVTAKAARSGAGQSHVLEWPWNRPATTVQRDERIAPPGHHDEDWEGGLMSHEGAVVLSEKAATILQGFPEDWVFVGKTKKIRWSQIGQAMPPPLARAVGASVAAQMAATKKR